MAAGGGAAGGGGQRADREIGGAGVVADVEVGLVGADRRAVGHRALPRPMRPARACRSIVCSEPGASVPSAQDTTCWPAARQPAGRSTGSRPGGQRVGHDDVVRGDGAGVRGHEPEGRDVADGDGRGADDALGDPDVDGARREVTRSRCCVKSGSKLKVPARGRVLLESAGLSTWVPALSGASVPWIVITRSSPGTELGDVAGNDREARGWCADTLPGRVELAVAGAARRSISPSGASPAPPAGGRPRPCRPSRARRCGGSACR